MAFIVAVAGKGGVGKSTISALLVHELARRSGKVVLAVDADPNSNLGDKLGVKVERTIGDIREDLLKRSDEVAAGSSKAEAVIYHLRLAMAEGREFDLVTMGRSEGRGCYCYINNLLRTFLDSVMDDYPYVVIDNEAGMEHLSRRTCQKMDVLLVVSDATKVGLETARRILELAKAMEIEVGRSVLLVSKIKEVPPTLAREAGTLGFDEWLTLPFDDAVEVMAVQGRPLTELPKSSPILRAIATLVEELR